MKKIGIGICALLFLGACAKKEKDFFTVTGTIENAPGKKVLLMEIPYASTRPVVLDSVTLDQKGAFALKALGPEESIYRLTLENGPDIILINDSKDIKVHLDVNNYRNYTVKGSAASESLHRLFEDYTRQDSVLLITFRQLDSLQKNAGNDSLVALVKDKRDEEIKGLNRLVKDYITQSPSPGARFYAIGLASRSTPPEELKPLIDASATKFKDHQGLAYIQKMVTAQASAKKPAYALLDQPAPEISLPDLNGKTVSLSSYRGKYVLVDFWASWCAPCRKENPNVVAAYNKFKDKNFTILGVSLDQEKSAWQEAVANDKLTWTHVSDLKQWESTVVPTYRIEGIPFNVLVDPTGKIIASELRGEELETKLAEVLK